MSSAAFDSVISKIKKGMDFLSALVQYAAKLRPFVITTATELEALIPDNGMGNIKLLAFDQALKIFIAASDMPANASDEGGPVWSVAHWLLEAYLAAQKAKAAIKP